MPTKIDCPECGGKKTVFYEWSNGIAQPCETCQRKKYTESEMQKAVEDEMEACAMMCENIQMDYWDDSTGKECAEAIRNRGVENEKK